MIPIKNEFVDLKKNISNELKVLRELNFSYAEFRNARDVEEKHMISSQINSLTDSFEKENRKIRETLDSISLTKQLKAEKKIKLPRLPGIHRTEIRDYAPPIEPVTKKPEIRRIEKKGLTLIEKETLKRLRKKEKKIVHKKERKASYYVRLANKIFSNTSKSLLNKGWFRNLKRDLVKANMRYLTQSYISVIFFTTFLSLIASIFIFIFFLFFNFGAAFPFITLIKGNIIERIGIVFWILIVIPLATFIFTYAYPSLEKKAIESKINHELPFATIHMSSISESMVEPSNIFKIIISTKEYPTLEREFIKLLNEINVFGHDLVTALRNNAFNSPSKKLAELFDGLATTITSGGDLSDFFEKRAQTLLFDYRLDKEKQAKSAETFMDIYISVVIAAPMILMLLLIMMRISGLGIALSTTMISLIMVLGVSAINIVFLAFLQLRQPKE